MRLKIFANSIMIILLPNPIGMDISIRQAQGSLFNDLTKIDYRRIEFGLVTGFCGDGNESPDLTEYAGNV
jgi:hypothetical protein